LRFPKDTVGTDVQVGPDRAIGADLDIRSDGIFREPQGVENAGRSEISGSLELCARMG